MKKLPIRGKSRNVDIDSQMKGSNYGVKVPNTVHLDLNGANIFEVPVFQQDDNTPTGKIQESNSMIVNNKTTRSFKINVPKKPK